MSTSITVPNTFAVLSRTPPIFGDANNRIPKIPLMAAAVAIDTEYNVKAHGRTANIANIERKASKGNQECYEVTKAGQDLIRNILAPHLRYADDGPHIELCNDGENNGHHNGERKIRL